MALLQPLVHTVVTLGYHTDPTVAKVLELLGWDGNHCTVIKDPSMAESIFVAIASRLRAITESVDTQVDADAALEDHAVPDLLALPTQPTDAVPSNATSWSLALTPAPARETREIGEGARKIRTSEASVKCGDEGQVKVSVCSGSGDDGGGWRSAKRQRNTLVDTVEGACAFTYSPPPLALPAQTSAWRTDDLGFPLLLTLDTSVGEIPHTPHTNPHLFEIVEKILTFRLFYRLSDNP
jgi:hypothetical protein